MVLNKVKERINVIKTVLSNKSYLTLFFAFFLIYLSLNFFLNKFYETLPIFLSFRLSLVLPYLVISLLIGIVASINLSIVVYNLNQLAAIKSETGATAFGILGGLMGGACPGCFVGLFPTLTGLLGTSLTLGSLPFNGFEIQIPALLVVLGSLYLVSNPNKCKIRK